MREFHACKQEEGQSVSYYVLKMKIYIDNLERLGHAMTQNLSVSLILVSLRKEYDGFVQNYNMHSMGKSDLSGVATAYAEATMRKLCPHLQNKLHTLLFMLEEQKYQKNQKKKSHKAAKGNQGKGKAKMGNALMPAPSYAPKPRILQHPRRIIL
ncbi:hypothetical protein Tco_1185955 [Tanacetum coccineum]